MKTRLNNISTLAFCCLLAACGSSGNSSNGSNSGGTGSNESLVATPKQLLTLQQQQSCSAVADYVATSIAATIIDVGIRLCPGCEAALTLSGRVDQLDVTTPAAASFDAFTGTNNQEAGVDEPDIVETDADGNFYLLDGGKLVIANGLPPADLRTIGSLELDPDRYAEGLLLDPDNKRLVVVLSERIFIGPLAASFAPVPWNPITELLFVDVADPANPMIERRLKVQGYRLTARRIGDRVHIATHWTPVIPGLIAGDAQLATDRSRLAAAVANDSDERDVIKQALRDRVKALVAQTDIENLLPEIMTADGNGAYLPVASQACADVALPDVPIALALTSVTSVDTDGSAIDSLHIVDSSWETYASENNIYLSQSSGGWWFSDRQRQQTAIHKISVGAGAPRYAATGVVDGWVGSSFQFSEQDGYLRVVTNHSEWDPAANVRQQGNHLFVLEDNLAGSLNTVGAVREFGADERIFSARFLGKRAFVVTFRQIDPLFAFDLSDPFDPRLVGELTIPGVSTYIHPLDETHLLTIGFDGDENRLNGDFQLQIFDVQNLSSPLLVDRYVPQFNENGYAWTAATYDHLAFNYFPDAGTLTVPLQYWTPDLDHNFSGFIAFSVDPLSGIEELGRLDHSDLARERFCTSSTGTRPVYCGNGLYLEAANPRRSVTASYAGQTYMYTLSNVGMKVSAASDFATAIALLPLPDRDDYPWFFAQ